ncbi:hypothetical protein BaRGS_00001499 [Batillaria attramentaria]|uniref:Uncharacterized protein n=1 Tax=Batillaria attramentaria TaxID=370345 RepID=A0ABD0M810_9CAEN
MHFCVTVSQAKNMKSQKLTVLAQKPMNTTCKKLLLYPHTEVWKPQRSTGDQEDSSRIPFFNSGFSACIRCGKQNVLCFEEKAGIRQNGEQFGTKIFLCQTRGCKWRTSFKYDDADPMCVHFETRGWPRGIMMFPTRYMILWCKQHGLKELRRSIYKRRLDGDEILVMYQADELETGLGINKKMANKMKKAIEKPDGAILQPPRK